MITKYNFGKKHILLYLIFIWDRMTVILHSVTQSCPTLCDPTDCRTPGFLTHHQLPELAQTHVHPTISSSIITFSHLQSFPASGSFPTSQLFASGGQSIGVSASASVLPMNIQDWFPLGFRRREREWQMTSVFLP